MFLTVFDCPIFAQPAKTKDVCLPPARRAQSFAERLRLGIAVIHGEAQDAESDQVDGRHSPPAVKTTGAIHPSMEIPCNDHYRSHPFFSRILVMR